MREDGVADRRPSMFVVTRTALVTAEGGVKSHGHGGSGARRGAGGEGPVAPRGEAAGRRGAAERNVAVETLGERFGRGPLRIVKSGPADQHLGGRGDRPLKHRVRPAEC